MRKSVLYCAIFIGIGLFLLCIATLIKPMTENLIFIPILGVASLFCALFCSIVIGLEDGDREYEKEKLNPQKSKEKTR